MPKTQPHSKQSEMSTETEPLITTPLIDADGNTVNEDGKGYQLCEFCEGYGEPHKNPSDICNCQGFQRSVASLDSVPERSDLLLRIAESAVLNKWSGKWKTPIDVGYSTTKITASHIEGGINDWRIIRIEFDGFLAEKLTEEYITPFGKAQIYGFSGDGTIRVKTKLSEQIQQKINEGCADSIDFTPPATPLKE